MITLSSSLSSSHSCTVAIGQWKYPTDISSWWYPWTPDACDSSFPCPWCSIAWRDLILPHDASWPVNIEQHSTTQHITPHHITLHHISHCALTTANSFSCSSLSCWKALYCSQLFPAPLANPKIFSAIVTHIMENREWGKCFNPFQSNKQQRKIPLDKESQKWNVSGRRLTHVFRPHTSSNNKK